MCVLRLEALVQLSLTNMTNLTLEEKRLQQLRSQLFGKQRLSSSDLATTTSQKAGHELAYLKGDLTKIIFLTFFAFAAQAILYWSLNHHLIKLPF